MDNSYAIESFINYCDGMMIAEENWSEYKNKVEEIRDEITYINNKISNTDDLRQCQKYVNEGIDSLNRLKKELSAIKFGTGGNNFLKIFGILNMILAAIGAIGVIICSTLFGGIVGFAAVGGELVLATGQYVISQVACGAIWGLIGKYNDKRIKEKEGKRRDITKEVNQSIKALEEMNEILNKVIANGGRTKEDLKDYKIVNVKNGIGQLVYDKHH